MVFYYLINPIGAYDLNEKVEWHAMDTYAKYLCKHPDDIEICKIMNDEVQHAQELHKAMELIK